MGAFDSGRVVSGFEGFSAEDKVCRIGMTLGICGRAAVFWVPHEATLEAVPQPVRVIGLVGTPQNKENPLLSLRV